MIRLGRVEWLASVAGTLAVFGVLVGSGLSFATEGDDAVPRLSGDYAFVQTRTCAQGAAGQPGMGDNLVLLSPATNRVAASRGVMSFDGQGGGRFETEELQLNMNIVAAGAQQVGNSSTTCALSYEVDRSGQVRIVLSDCFSIGLSGSITNLTFTASDIHLDGRLSIDGKTLLLSDLDPSVSTVTTHFPAGGESVSTRVCTRTGTAVRVR